MHDIKVRIKISSSYVFYKLIIKIKMNFKIAYNNKSKSGLRFFKNWGLQ
jgi:hypothetical protein